MLARSLGRAGRVMVARLMVVNRCNITTSGSHIIVTACITSSSLPDYTNKLSFPPCSSSSGLASLSVRHFSDDVSSSQSEGSSSSDDEDEWTSLYDKVAKTSLSFVEEHGWSLEAILAGVNSLRLPGVAHGVLKNGGHDLLKYFEEECNSQLANYLRDELEPLLFNDEDSTGSSFITLEEYFVAAIMKRLHLIQPHLHRWHEALVIKTDPRNSWSHFHNLSIIADDIWYHCRDQSIDCDWYVKRGMLAMVYKRAEDHMMKDFSQDLIVTRRHVEQMVGQMMTRLASIRLARSVADKFSEIGHQCVSEMGSSLIKVCEVFNAGITTTKIIIGMNN